MKNRILKRPYNFFSKGLNRWYYSILLELMIMVNTTVNDLSSAFNEIVQDWRLEK